MTRDEALATLRGILERQQEGGVGAGTDHVLTSHSHRLADHVLLALINDDEIAEAYEAIRQWYA
jgi:hypothetical protein